MEKPRRMVPLHQPSVALGLLGVLALLAIYILPALLYAEPAGPLFIRHKGECQSDRRTKRHGSGFARQDGNYTPCLIDTGMTSGEPGLAISRDGTLLRSVATSPTGIAISTDNGKSWFRRPLPSDARSGIPDGYIDPITDRYFYSALGNSPVFFSDDKGISWQKGSFDSPDRYDWNRVFSGAPVKARARGYPTNIYYCNMTEPGGFATGARCFKSIDGGKSFRTTGPDPYKQGDCIDLTQPRGSGLGRGIVDPRDGAVYIPVNFCGVNEVVVSNDEGESWSRRPVEKVHGAGAKGLIDALASPAWRKQLMRGRSNIVPAEMAEGQNSDALGMDAAGRLYFVWNDAAYLPVLAWSGDKGRTWSKPVRLNPPEVVQSVLTSIAVLPNGRVGISYYGTTDKATWTGYLAISDNATSAAPVFDTASVTRPGQPLMPEPCCWASGPQEYTIARWAPDGSLWGAFVATVPSGDGRGVLGHLVPRQSYKD